MARLCHAPIRLLAPSSTRASTAAAAVPHTRSRPRHASDAAAASNTTAVTTTTWAVPAPLDSAPAGSSPPRVTAAAAKAIMPVVPARCTPATNIAVTSR
ncbi:hypothetical protein SAMN05421833_13352 [Microbispora rosea]|uniref:Uncharacterized protein n=1 Tax=Microbispora rosea TaxID=58117 RepID=A0A1N7GW36_9ACTN|nr:hypothetical protein SAMN05421833_13352 [Microbispora rosea]